MKSDKQTEAVKENIKKAQAVWQAMSPRQRAIAQPEGRARKRPGSTGKGKFFRIEVRPKSQFTSFRVHDVGDPGGLERVAGRRSSGSWATAAWLISKDDAYKTKNNKLVIIDSDTRTVLDSIEGPIQYVKGDIFKAKPRKNIAEKDKPTEAQKEAWGKNIKKAQAARRKKNLKKIK